MSTLPIITLLTDFGLQDVYVGVMKGVIAQITPNLKVVDLTHAIAPQDLLAARFSLLNAYPYFPDNTIHTVVVDPGVGSQRQGIAVRTAAGYFVAPDNGVLSGVFSQSPPLEVVTLSNPDYWRNANPSTTFHGRDIFVPVAAYLARGVSLANLGDKVDPASLVSLPIPQPEIKGNMIQGSIQYIDHFGNLISNIPAETIADQTWSVNLNSVQISQGKTYSDISPGQTLALIGSHGWLEVAINQGHAAQQLQVKVGDSLKVMLTGH
jgi:S-adenosylmethionine hydrolase